MKNMMLLSVLALGLLVFSCDKNEINGPANFELGEAFELPWQGTGDCECGSLSVTFADVIEDSRCPTGVECVWQGRAVVKLAVGLPTGDTSVLLTSQAGDAKLARDTVGGYIIELLEVAPYPVHTEPIEEEEYRISLLVTDLED